MPKETFRFGDNYATVGWTTFHEEHDHEDGELVELSIGGLGPFRFEDEPDTVYDSLYFYLTSREETNRFAAALRRAARKAFPST